MSQTLTPRSATESAWPAWGRGDLGLSLFLIFPLFLLYQVGVLSAQVNGVDLVSDLIFSAVGHNARYYLIIHLVLAALFVGLVFYLRDKRVLSFQAVAGVVVESVLYALTMGSLIIFVMRRIPGMESVMSAFSTGDKIIMSLGAGVHEELVFRLVLMAGGIFVLSAVGIHRGLAFLFAIAGSSLVFSAVHHIGPYGDDWAIGVFTYRALAGILFGLIFYYRSLAHAVYTHAIYDLYVLLLLR